MEKQEGNIRIRSPTGACVDDTGRALNKMTKEGAEAGIASLFMR